MAGAAGGSTAPGGRPAPSTPCTYADRPARTGRTTCCWTRTRSPRATTSSSSGSASRARTARLLAYSVDHDGSEVYRLRVRDLATGADLPDELTGTYYGLGWSADGSQLPLHDARRRVPARPGAPARPRHRAGRRHRGLARGGPALRAGGRADAQRRAGPARRAQPGHLGGAPGADRGARTAPRCRSRAGCRAASTSSTTSPGRTAAGWWSLTDLDAPEYRVMTAPVSQPGTEHWSELLPHDPAVRVEGADVVRRARRGVRALRRASCGCASWTRRAARCGWCSRTRSARSVRLGTQRRAGHRVGPAGA